MIDRDAEGKSVAEKARVKDGTTFAVLNPTDGVLDQLGLPETTRFVEPAEADILCVFVRDKAGLVAALPGAATTLRAGATLWVFFRKGSKAAGHDVNRDDVWHAADEAGLRPIGLISVDRVWSIFRLRRS